VAETDDIYARDAVIYMCSSTATPLPTLHLTAVDVIFEQQDQRDR
jgi:hypothetical protein